MCGILCSIAKKSSTELYEINAKRGPDSSKSHTLKHAGLEVEFHGFVLHLRGQLTPQPLVQNNRVLCFNGEIYRGLDIGLNDNDTAALFAHLELHDVFSTMQSIHGEWAFCYFDDGILYFGRDFLGRRSLLFRFNDGEFQLASCGYEDGWEEVPATGIFKLDLKNCSPDKLDFQPWPLGCVQLSLNSALPNLNQEDLESYLVNIDETLESVLSGFKSVLSDAVKERIISIPIHADKVDCSSAQSRVAILFSGGLDCITLARLVHEYVPKDEPIDLLNVSFENPRISRHRKKTGDTTDIYQVPDRITGLLGHQELSALCDREWRFVEINIPYSQVIKYKEHIISLMKPLYTVMDLSIAMAFWFASRGIGFYNSKEYESRAKVLISGLGADEQLGGYGRHHVAYARNGWQGLLEELSLDVSRISKRNLGRDDRIISDHGKEARFPFLDENVVKYLSELPVHQKADPRFPKGVGDKLLLRRLASKLGLARASKEPKRAVQFGARTAKMEFSNQKGQDLL